MFKCSDLTIHKLFATRADLHRTVYTHAKVKVPDLHVPYNSWNSRTLRLYPTNYSRWTFLIWVNINLSQAIDLMVVDTLMKANDFLNIVSQIHEPATFWKVCDLHISRLCLRIVIIRIWTKIYITNAVGWHNFEKHWSLFWSRAPGV